MIKAGLYERGTDPVLDHAVRINGALDDFIAGKSPTINSAFKALEKALGMESGAAENAEAEAGGDANAQAPADATSA